MKLIELHILQSFPVSCLNRDDVGSPKSAVFGGVPRARISSQCLKRAIRLEARENSTKFSGIRSRFLKQPFIEALKNEGLDLKIAEKKASDLCSLLTEGKKKKKDKRDKTNEVELSDQVDTAIYLSPDEIKEIALRITNGVDPDKAVEKVDRLDAADIALFGRMVAAKSSLNIEGAAMFSHALSTHRSANDIDYYSAVDDRKADSDDSGAAMIGTLEFNSSTYYRYAAVNLDLLNRESHLKKLGKDERIAVLKTFIEAALKAVPGARKNSMNAASLPYEVLGVFKAKGQPLQLINAFEAPVASNGKGLAATSLEAMKQHHTQLKDIWGIKPDVETWLTEDKLEKFVTRLVEHVD